MSIQASLDYEAVNRIEQWVQRLECVGYQIEQAIGKMQPCQKTNANAGTGATNAKSSPTTTTCTDDTTTAGISTTTPVTPSAKPSQPAEPEAVSRLRQWMNAPEGERSILICLLREMAGGSLTHIDTLSARLKMAEKLLGEIRNAFLDDRFGDYLNIVDAFLAGKEPT